MATLQLALNGEYFDAIRDGVKREEYRLANDYWTKRLVGKCFDRIILTKGYPKADDAEKRIELPWKGFTRKLIFHKHFGTMPVFVYAIDVAH